MKSANANPHIFEKAAYFALSRAVPISAIIASTAALDASAKCSSPYFATAPVCKQQDSSG